MSNAMSSGLVVHIKTSAPSCVCAVRLLKLRNRHAIKLGRPGVRVGKTCLGAAVGKGLQGFPVKEIRRGLHGKNQSRAPAELELETAIRQEDGFARELRRRVRVQ